MHRAALHGVVELHPRRRAPGRGEEEQIGIDLLGEAQRGQNVCAIVIDAELGQPGIGLRALIEAVDAGGVVAGSDARATDGEPQAVRSVELAQDRVAVPWIELREKVARGIGEGSAEAENVLIPSVRVDPDDRTGIGSGRFPAGAIKFGKAPRLGSDAGLQLRRLAGGLTPRARSGGQGRGGVAGELKKITASTWWQRGHVFLAPRSRSASCLSGEPAQPVTSG